MKIVPSLISTSLLTTSLVVLCATGIPGLVMAQADSLQKSDEELLGELPAEQVGDRAADLLARIQDTIEDGERYQAMLATASAEDSLVLRRQLTSRQVQALSDVHELADVLFDKEQAGPLPELRARVEETYLTITPRLWVHIDRLRGEIDATRALRTTLPVEERPALEDRVDRLTRRLDVSYELSLAHLEKMEKLELDTTEATAMLTESLLSRADELSGRLDLDIERIDDLKKRLRETPDDAGVSVLIVTTLQSKDNNTTSLSTTLDIMDVLELPTADYRTQLVTATSDITTGLLDRGVFMSLARRGLDSFMAWLTESGPKLLIKLLLFVSILLIFRFAARLVRKGVARSLDASKLDISMLLRDMIIKSASNLVLLFGLLVALSQLGISLGPLLAGLGVAGFILGFALQDSLANFAAGMMILIYRPYDVGDLVDIGGAFGKVEKMSLVSTSILTVDNQKIVVPNNKIWGDVIKNVTDQDIRRIDMVFGIAYSDDIPHAEKVLGEILAQDDRILNDPEPVVHLHTLGESSVDFIVRPWVKVDDYWDVYWYVTRAVKMRFDEEGINIPFPQRDVHLYSEQTVTPEQIAPGTGEQEQES